jgi:eukaryotic-like serine/threonine-protein kinase
MMSTQSSTHSGTSILLEPPEEALLGRQIGSYELVRQIGMGPTGGVFLATHRKLGTHKAVKVLVAPYFDSDRAVARFEQEALAVAKVDHRNIIKIDDVGMLPSGERYILMPFIEGGSLEQFLAARRGPVSIHLTLHILAQVCAALDAAHAERIVHRDLKPANILLTTTPDAPWHVTLIDFGVAKLGAHVGGFPTEKGEVYGTPSYMAAEHIEDASAVDFRVDVFALGVIAYRMVTGGDLPFGPSKKVEELYRRQRADRPRRPASVPAGWADQILSALALRPEHRPASAGAFALALAAATPPSPPKYPAGDAILAAAARELLANGSGPVLQYRDEPAGHSRSVGAYSWPPSATWMSSERLEEDAASCVPVPILEPEAPTIVLRKA